MSGIRLSEEHGVNPSVIQCFYCGKDYGVALFGKLKNDEEAPRTVCFGPHSEPCEECKQHMEDGVILISIDQEKTKDVDNPWRTGCFAVVKEDLIRRAVGGPELVEAILRKRVAFLPDEVWDALGLPRGESEQ